MKRFLHIVGNYSSFDFELTEDNLCIVKIRNQEPKLITIDEAKNNFNNIPWVKGCGGILHSYIFNSETKEKQYEKTYN